MSAAGWEGRPVHRRAAYDVDKILKGSRPAHLPGEQLTRFELMINLKTTKALGRVAAVSGLLILLVLLGGPLASEAQDAGKVPPGAPASRSVVLELQQALTAATERFQAMDRAGVLSQISNQYRTDSLTKAGVGEQLRVMFALYDTVRAQVRIDEVRTAGEQAWIYSTGEVSGRLRGLGTWMSVLSWKHEPEVARREQGVWRLYGFQQ
jgi:hypothetical protein